MTFAKEVSCWGTGKPMKYGEFRRGGAPGACPEPAEACTEPVEVGQGYGISPYPLKGGWVGKGTIRPGLTYDQTLVTPVFNCPAGESREGRDPLWQGFGDSPTRLGRVGGKKNRSFDVSLTTRCVGVKQATSVETPPSTGTRWTTDRRMDSMGTAHEMRRCRRVPGDKLLSAVRTQADPGGYRQQAEAELSRLRLCGLP